MAVFIDSDIIVGNFLIEKLKRNQLSFNVKELYDYEKKLSVELKKIDYYSRFFGSSVREFADEYPYFVKSLENDVLTITTKEKYDEKFLMLLKRYFRFGVASIVVEKMEQCM